MTPEKFKLISMPEYLQAKLSEIKPEDYKSVFDFLTEKMIEGRNSMLLEIMENNGVPTDNSDLVTSVQNAMMEYGDICEESLDVGVLSKDDLRQWVTECKKDSVVEVVHEFQFHLAKVNKEWRKRK